MENNQEPPKAPSVASRRERSESAADSRNSHLPPGPVPTQQDAAAAAKAAFEREDEMLDEYRLSFDAHLRLLRSKHLRQEMATINVETPRIVAAVRDNKYGDIIEDRALADQMASDAQQQANSYFMKYRTARGLGNLAKDTTLAVEAMEESIVKYCKQLAAAASAAKDLVVLACDSDDASSRIAFYTKVKPQWHLIYELLYARTKQWLYSVHLYELLSDAAKRLSKSATADRVRQEVNALDVDMTDDDDGESDDGEDGEDAESTSDD